MTWSVASLVTSAAALHVLVHVFVCIHVAASAVVQTRVVNEIHCAGAARAAIVHVDARVVVVVVVGLQTAARGMMAAGVVRVCLCLYEKGVDVETVCAVCPRV